MVRMTLSAADMTVCYDPSDSTACCRHLSTSSTLAVALLAYFSHVCLLQSSALTLCVCVSQDASAVW